MKYIKKENEEEYKQAFLELKSVKQLSELMGTSSDFLTNVAYELSNHKKYKTFVIPKKSGGLRMINSPTSSLKLILESLNEFLQLIYEPTISAHGFIKDRNIVSNAKLHVNKKFVFNIDLKDFFPSINFGRVRGLLINKPYNLSNSVATVIAQLCCYENALPQGAPTSPVITNMICSKLDSSLLELANQYNCNYTRYADDMTFSSEKKFSEGFKVRLRKNIKYAGFDINETKLRIQSRIQHQEVTGLVVNEKVNIKRSYIRKLRAILHSWESKGLNEASKIYYEKYNRYRVYGLPGFIRSVNGMLLFVKMVRGSDDEIYLKLKARFDVLKSIKQKIS